MNLRSLALATLFSVLPAIALATFPAATLAAAQDTEDILVMEDGRTLHGHIISENPDEIVFELVDRKLNLKTKLTFSRDKIVEIRRGVAIEGAPAKAAKPVAAPEAAPKDADKPAPAAAGDSQVPRIYVIPMKGQMGTDIHPDIYKEVVKDIKAEKPALIIFELYSRDVDDLMIPKTSRAERGLLAFEEYRELVNVLKDDLREFPQVMWVKDAAGISSMIALAWRDLYMTSSARLTGLSRVITDTGAQQWSDEDIRAKMTAAYLGYANGFLENGGYPIELGKAMMMPDHSLSASFEGRKVVWQLDDEGQFVVDNDPKAVVSFRARTAENLGISKGTVNDQDDLLFLLGYREYQIAGQKGREIVEDYSKDWRKARADSFKAWEEYEQFRSWASGEDTLKYLGQAKQRITQIISAMTRFKPVEIRWRVERGVEKTDLIVLEEQLKEMIQALKRGGRAGGGGGGGRGAGLGGG